MKIEDWLYSSFTLDSKIKWPCPSCGNTSLSIKKDNLHYEYTAETQEMVSREQTWDDEWLKYTFSGFLHCRSCSEFIAVSGSGQIIQLFHFDKITGEQHDIYAINFEPSYFHPPLHIFPIPEKCPETLKDRIVDTFKLYWVDPSSCANKIRIALEHLMDQQKVVKTESTKKGKRRKLKLHERIVKYESKNKKVADLLLAIKWIGNSGSHLASLQRHDLLDAYQLLEFSLKKLYDNKEIELVRLSKKINTKRKGIR